MLGFLVKLVLKIIGGGCKECDPRYPYIGGKLETNDKKPWQSKTILINLALAVTAAFFPPAQEWITNHPLEVSYGFMGLNVILRLVSKGAIYLVD